MGTDTDTIMAIIIIKDTIQSKFLIRYITNSILAIHITIIINITTDKADLIKDFNQDLEMGMGQECLDIHQSSLKELSSAHSNKHRILNKVF